MGHSRIYIVAGPRACGKSSFIERCAVGETTHFLPATLSGLATARGPVYFMDLADQEPAEAEELLVHVDLLTPFADQPISSEEELRSTVQSRAFSEYPGTSLFRDCTELAVLTLRVPRITTLRRWLQRSAEQGRTNVRRTAAQIYSDAFAETGYSSLYDAWDEYVAGLPNATNWNVFESADGRSYSVIRADAGQNIANSARAERVCDSQ